MGLPNVKVADMAGTDRVRTAASGGLNHMADDPSRGLRTAATGGLSEAYGASQDPAKKKAQEAEDAANSARDQGYKTSDEYLGQMGRTADKNYAEQKGRADTYLQNREQQDTIANKADSDYSNSLANLEIANQGRVSDLLHKAEDQANNAQQNYTNSIQPSFKNAMEKADQNAGQAMSLQDAGDMNNKVQQGVRQFFDKQASNAGRSGMQDVGMLQSLGAQANAQQMGAGAPMTGAQMQLMQAGNANQAGQAFANVQKRMQGLKDQGIAQGIQQSSDQYNRGQQAVNTAADQRNNFMGAEQNNMTMGTNARNEQNAFGNERLQSQKNQHGDIYQGTMSQYNRNLDRAGVNYNTVSGLESQRLNDQQMRSQMGMNNALGKTNDAMQVAYGQQAAANQQMASQNQMIGAGIQAGGTVAGGVFGGPAGAAAGGAAGGAIGQGVANGMNGQNAYQAPPRQQQGVSAYGGYSQRGYA